MTATQSNQTVFIGRDKEIEQLTAIFEQVQKSQKPAFLLVNGEFGVGKTTLVEHFLLAHELAKDIIITRAKCAAETELNSLLPFSQLLVNTVRGEVSAEGIANFFIEVAPAWLDIVALGIPGAIMTTVRETRKLRSDSQQIFTQENIFVQFTNSIRKLTSSKKLLVAFLDDLQWADESSLYLLSHLSSELKNVPVLFICAYRNVSAMETGKNADLFRKIRSRLVRNGAAEIVVTGNIQIADYVSQRYSFHKLPPKFITIVQERTGGHPLYVSQLFSLWEETGQIVCTKYGERDVWELLNKINEITIPQSIGYVLEERIRRMTDDLRRILTIASIEGEDFTLQVLVKLDQLEEYLTYDQVELLERNYMMVESNYTLNTGFVIFDFYRFTHRFFREYIYDQLSPAKKRMLHANVGQTLHDLYQHDLDSIAGQLAYHFREAGDRPKAAQYAVQAAQFELKRYGWIEAEKLCFLALELLEFLSPEQRISIQGTTLECLAIGYFHSGKYREAYETYSKLLDLSEKLQLPPLKIASICAMLADIGDNTKRLTEAQKHIEQGREVIAQSGSEISEVQVELDISQAQILIRLCSLTQAVDMLKHSFQLARHLPDTVSLRKTLARGYNTLGIALGNINHYLEAERAFQAGINLAQKVGDLKLAVDCMLNLASDYYEQVKSLEVAKGLVAKALEIAEQIGDMDGLAYAYNTHAQITLASGDPDKAIVYFDRSIKLSREISALWNMPYMYADLSRAYLALNNAAKAKQNALRATKYTFPDEFVMGYALEPLGRAEAILGNSSASYEYFQQAIAIFEKAGHRHYVARTKMYWAESLIQANNLAEAEALLKTILPVFNDLQLNYDASVTLKLLDRSKNG